MSSQIQTYELVPGDTYYFVFGAKDISILNGPEGDYAKTLTEAEVGDLQFSVMWTGEKLAYQSSDKVGIGKLLFM